MSLALRYGACGSFVLAAVLLGAALALPVERIEPATGPVHAGAWAVDGGLQGRDGNTTQPAFWFSGTYGDADGIWLLRLAGPLLLVGVLVLLVCAFTTLAGKGVVTGWTGTAALLLAGLGSLFLLLGISMFAKSVTEVNAVLDSQIRPDIGFWSMFAGLLVGVGAALAAFNVKPPIKGRVGPDGEPLPPLPILSVENPSAFNPMANRDPRLFKPGETEYKSFEVTGGPKTFKPAEKKGEEEEDAWSDMEAPEPKPAAAKPAAPAAKPTAPAAKSAAPVAKPAAPAAKPAAPAAKPAAKPAAPPAKGAPPPAQPAPPPAVPAAAKPAAPAKPKA